MIFSVGTNSSGKISIPLAFYDKNSTKTLLIQAFMLMLVILSELRQCSLVFSQKVICWSLFDTCSSFTIISSVSAQILVTSIAYMILGNITLTEKQYWGQMPYICKRCLRKNKQGMGYSSTCCQKCQQSNYNNVSRSRTDSNIVDGSTRNYHIINIQSILT